MPTISGLTAATAPDGTESLPVVQAGTTKKATVTQVAPVRSVAGRTGAVVLTSADVSGVATLDAGGVVVQPPAAHGHQAYTTVRQDGGGALTGRSRLNIVGATVTDDATNLWTTITIPTADVRTIVTTAATTVTNSATFTDIAGLTTNLEANGHFEGTAVIFYDATTIADARLTVNVPTGATIRGLLQGLGGGVTTEVGSNRLHAVTSSGMSGMVVGGLGAGVAAVAMFNLRVQNGATAGPITFQIRQDTAEAATSAVAQAGSWLTIARIA